MSEVPDNAALSGLTARRKVAQKGGLAALQLGQWPL
jgi:hypothetical protein